ncbi:MAG TPA: tetratricopeptide repeat protein [Kofleriaceae bacterium]|jgi:tetratricopeptide (TPR) repeat protein
MRTTLRQVVFAASLLTAGAALALPTVAFAQRASEGDDESAALVAQGRADLKKGNYNDAATALDQAIALNPRRVEAYVLRSAVYAAKKEYAKGVELMRRAQALSPNDEEVLTALGSQLVLSGNTDEGVPILQGVVAKNAARYDAQLLLGNYAHGAGKWPDAIAALEAYFKSRPDVLAKEDARHRVDLADSYLRYRQPDKALPLFQSAANERKEDLRARIGVAWSTAALDCKKARPLLRDLEPIAEQHPEVWLVDGQCALVLGDTTAALERGKRYLDRAPEGSAAGHALVGEAQAARNNLPEARKELDKARELEPTRRRWSVRYAHVLRRANEPKAAIGVLDKLGAPEKASIDPDWYTEMGEALLASGDAAGAAAKLMPVLVEIPNDAPLRVVTGAALLETGKGDDAVRVLSEAETIGSTPRGKKLLVDALTLVAVQKITANDAAAAEPLLAKADQLDGSPIVWRNLGIARLALNKPADAVTPLDKAAKQEASGLNLFLDARAHASNNDLAGARTLYDRALGVEKSDLAVDIAIDWAASELNGGDPTNAVTALEKVASLAKGPLAARHKAALAIARHAAGIAALKQGNGQKAAELLKGSVALDPSLATKCDFALAQVVVGEPNGALAALKVVTGQSCPFPPPADTQAAPILAAFTEGRNAKKAGKALDKLTALAGKSSGAAAVLLNTSIRVVALEAAQDAYRSGQVAAARKYLTTAKNVNSRVGTDELAHNLAVLDLVDGNVDSAIAQLERVAPKIPEAYINLGIAYERKGDPAKALDAWRKARKANARFAPLNDWIESKERIYGGGDK